MSLFEKKTEKKSKDLEALVAIRDEILKSPIYSLDLETTGFSFTEDVITVISFATREKKWAIRVKDYGENSVENQEAIKIIYKIFLPLFNDRTKIVVMHNGKFDLLFLRYKGVEILCKLADTMVMAWLWREDHHHYSHGLKECALVELNEIMTSYNEACGLFGRSLLEYAAEDSFQTLRLFDVYEKKLTTLGLMNWFWEVEMPITRCLVDMEFRGVKLDAEKLKKLKVEAFEELDKLEKEIYKVVGHKFDINSAKQIAKILFEEMRLGDLGNGLNQYSERSEKSKEFSTSDEVLQALARDNHEIGKLLLKYREINTRNNTFIKPLLDRCRVDAIIHPEFNQIGTVSGRFSSKNPNYQNLPRDGGVRAAFIAREGYKIIRCDYSQAELRLMAHYSGDPEMIRIYQNKGDIHTTTAEACGLKGKEGRQAAKAINFGLVYRMSPNRLQAQLLIPPPGGKPIHITDAQAKEYVRKYFEKYSYVRIFHKKVEDSVKARLAQNGEFGYVTLLSGRQRRLDKEYLTNHETAYTAITQAINSIIQGGVSDLIKWAMVQIQEEFRKRGWLDPGKGIWDAYIQGQCHDEVFVECKEGISEEVSKIVKIVMEDAGKIYNIKVPMLADPIIVTCLAKG